MASLISTAQSALFALLDGGKGAQYVNDLDVRSSPSLSHIKAGSLLKAIKDLVVAQDAAVVTETAKREVLTATATFDPSANAGERTVGAHPFGVGVPDKAVILRAWYEVITTFTSAGGDAGTVSLGIVTDGAAGIVAAIAISDGTNPWDAGTHGAAAGALVAGPIKATAARQFVATVAVQALTAGKLVLHVEYVIGA